MEQYERFRRDVRLLPLVTSGSINGSFPFRNMRCRMALVEISWHGVLN
jgi:hypothetical protein